MGDLMRHRHGNKTVLLTGGAGYVGSHVALALLQEGYEVIVLDDLSKGFAEAVTGCELVQGDTGNKDLLALLLGKRRVAAVMHFAGSTIVPGIRGRNPCGITRTILRNPAT